MQKKIGQWISWVLTFAMVVQLWMPVYAEEPEAKTVQVEDGVVLTYNADGTITARITAPGAEKGTRRAEEEPRLSDKGDSFIHETEDLRLVVEKTYTDGSTLSTVETETGGCVVFYPEMASGEIPAEQESETEEAPAETETPAEDGSACRDGSTYRDGNACGDGNALSV